MWVLINGQKVKLRLIGIDTPEKYPGKKLERDARECSVSKGHMKNLGQEATHHAKKLLHKGEQVKVVTYGHDCYGRTLAIIYLPDGTNYNEKMVADGYACVYRYCAHKSRQLPQEEKKKLNQLLEEAKKNRRGLWGKDYRVMECLCR
ncbi:MAG: thermonuclease family protein [Candidatus Desulfofervidaceae bacterium]|nr:thermonuclease family protein [Candidatus Desulfofervidaceae bacterium]